MSPCRSTWWKDDDMRIALVVYEGVLDDECEAFRSVLGLLRGAEVDARDEVRRGGGGAPGIVMQCRQLG